MEDYIISADNYYLDKDTKAYYTLDYYGGEYKDDTRFILDFKNTFGEKSDYVLNNAKAKAVNILKREIAGIIDKENLSICTVIAVPRAKDFESYLPQQLYFIDAVSEAARELDNVIDGTACIIRHTDTKTTHLRRETGRKTIRGDAVVNDGDSPYPGITRNTCHINTDYVKGQTIILVDDIYTAGCKVDEDCIQALYDAGAKEVIFYSFAKTVKRY